MLLKGLILMQSVSIQFTHQKPDLQNILRQSDDGAKVTMDLRRTSNLSNAMLFLGTIHLHNRKIV